MPQLTPFAKYSIWLLAASFTTASGKTDLGRIESIITRTCNVAREQRPMLANTKIYVLLSCKTYDGEIYIKIHWTLIERECWYEEPWLQNAYDKLQEPNKTSDKILISPEITAKCPSPSIILPEINFPLSSSNAVGESGHHPLAKSQPIVTITRDGLYDLAITIDVWKSSKEYYKAPVVVKIMGPHGYISVTDWPLLPFFGIMCIVYVIFGLVWLVSLIQWRDLLPIQLWIGGVILLGMLEKALFYVQYQSLNTTGVPVQGAEWAAEFVSCAKRSLARVLVIITSLGFGIVQPCLGPMLNRVVGVGALYFVMAFLESYLRIMCSKTDEGNELILASIPRIILDTGSCWWIFRTLMQTTRSLRSRKDMVKLTLYGHFTNTLIFSVTASVIYMLFAKRLRKSEICATALSQLWIDVAFWHVLFSVLLLVIMILYRPRNNKKFHNFTLLLDNLEDIDVKENRFVTHANGLKVCGTQINGPKTPSVSKKIQQKKMTYAGSKKTYHRLWQMLRIQFQIQMKK